MKAADRSGAKFALVAGEQEITAEVVNIKNLQTGEQHSVPTSEVIPSIISTLHP